MPYLTERIVLLYFIIDQTYIAPFFLLYINSD